MGDNILVKPECGESLKGEQASRVKLGGSREGLLILGSEHQRHGELVRR